MLRPLLARRAVTVATSLLAALALAIVPAAASAATATTPAAAPPVAAPTPTPTPTATPGACPAGAEVLATTAGAVAERIYAAEVKSAETESDKRQIESYVPLLEALERRESTAIEAAVHSLVYSHTHIVRLRVDRGSELLSDIGGPYILAPVSGLLRAHGKTIGHFVFSVQDDLGYVKLVTRFLGVPLVMRSESGQIPIEGLLSPGPATIPDHGPVSYGGAGYQAYSFRADAYPSGRLRISLLLPLSSSLNVKSCDRIKAEELGLVAQRISRRFKLSPSAFAGYIRLVRTMTHGLVYIRAGSHTLAGSTHAAPAKLPPSGALRWHGVDYEVSSFRAPSSAGTIGVYLLVAH